MTTTFQFDEIRLLSATIPLLTTIPIRRDNSPQLQLKLPEALHSRECQPHNVGQVRAGDSAQCANTWRPAQGPHLKDQRKADKHKDERRRKGETGLPSGKLLMILIASKKQT